MTAEFALVLACCRWPDDDARRAAIGAVAASVGDWTLVTALARRHRVEPLVAHGLTAAGIAVPDTILAAAADARRDNLRAIATMLAIGKSLDAAAIPHRFLKGVTVGQLAFGTPQLKRSWDIDLLVLPSDAVTAAACLRRLRYDEHVPPRALNAAEFRRWSVVAKEAEMRRADGQVIELHWRLSDHAHLLAGIDAALPGQPVNILGDHDVKTLEASANLAYLAVHGAGHGWVRLKWLADFNALLAQQSPAARSALIDAARRWPTGRALDLALLLSHRLLALPGPPAVPDHATERLAALAIEAMQAPVADDNDPFGNPAIRQAVSRGRWAAAPGIRHRLAEARLRLRGSEDRRHFPLPHGLHWAYLPMRPLLWGWRRLSCWATR